MEWQFEMDGDRPRGRQEMKREDRRSKAGSITSCCRNLSGICKSLLNTCEYSSTDYGIILIFIVNIWQKAALNYAHNEFKLTAAGNK